MKETLACRLTRRQFANVDRRFVVFVQASGRFPRANRHTKPRAFVNKLSHERLSVKQRHGIPVGTALSSAADAPVAPASSKYDASNDELVLQRFLSWLIANGVKGIGQEGSKAALFQTENGERGLLCEEPISAGEVVFEVPLRLALTEHPGDEESNQLVYAEAPWSARLTCKLLRHRAAGDRSPWAPYIKVLPRHVPAPLECYSWEDLTSLRYPPAMEALHAADWLRSDAFQSTSNEARGGLGEEEFRWALSVVHSRTFANAAPGGGVGVRMLVPLVDMLNHGGDEAAEGSLGLVGAGGGEEATDNVRWDLLPPGRSSTGGWCMAVSATRDVYPGQELLLSYGERPNDDFFIHYGFVPRANPHDDAVLWPDLEAALEWHYKRLGALQLPPEAAEPLYSAALAAERQVLSAELQEQLQPQEQRKEVDVAGGSGGGGGGGGGGKDTREGEGEAQRQVGDEELLPEVVRQLTQLKVVAGGQVSAAVMRAFTAVSGGDVAAAARAVALRAAELLWTMSVTSSSSLPPAMAGPTGSAVVAGGLLTDLAALLADADPRVAVAAVISSPSAAEAELDVEPESDAGRYWAAQLRGYWQTLLPQFADLLPEGPAAAAAFATATAAVTAIPTPVTMDPRDHGHAATATATASPRRVPAAAGVDGGGGSSGSIKSRYGRPPQVVSASLPSEASGQISQAVPVVPDAAGAVLPLGKLLRVLLPHAVAEAEAEVRVAAGGKNGFVPSAFRLTGPQRLSAAFRSYKQMVFWDVVLGCGLAPAELAAFVQELRKSNAS